MEQIRRIMRPTDVPDTGNVVIGKFWAFLLFFWHFFRFSNQEQLAMKSKHLLYFIGLLCDLLWSDPDKDVQGWGENDRGVSFTFGADVVSKFLNRHDLDLICRAHQVCR